MKDERGVHCRKVELGAAEILSDEGIDCRIERLGCRQRVLVTGKRDVGIGVEHRFDCWLLRQGAAGHHRANGQDCKYPVARIKISCPSKAAAPVTKLIERINKKHCSLERL